MLSVTFAFWGVSTFVPTYVGSIAAKAGLPAAHWAGSGRAVLPCAAIGFVSLGFLADLWPPGGDDAVLSDVPHPDPRGLSMGAQRLRSAILGRRVRFLHVGIWAWAPIWLPELFPTRMRSTAIAFSFNAPRFIACIGPLIAGTLIVALGGYGPAATIIGSFFILGFVVAPFVPETKGRPLPELVEVQRVYTATRRSAA